MAAESYEISLESIFGVLLKNKLLILISTILFLIFGFAAAGLSTKKVVVITTIEKTNEQLTQPFFRPLLKYNLKKFLNLDQELFEVVDEIVYSKYDFEQAILKTGEYQRQSKLGTFDSSMVSAAANSLKVLFDPYTNQYTLAVTTTAQVEKPELLISQALDEIQLTVLKKFKNNLSKYATDALKTLNKKLEAVKYSDSIENQYLKNAYEVSYSIAKRAGVERPISAIAGNLGSAAYSLMGTKLLEASLHELQRKPFFSRNYFEIKEMHDSLKSQSLEFEDLPGFEVKKGPACKVGGRFQKILIVLLSAFFGSIIGCGIVLYQFMLSLKKNDRGIQ